MSDTHALHTPIAQVMTPIRHTLGPHHTLADAARRMRDAGFGAFVISDGTLATPAVITDRAIVDAIADGRDPVTTHVDDIMTHELVSASGDTPIEEAARLMISRQVRHVLVMAGADIVGVVSMRDLVRGVLGEGIPTPRPPVSARA